MLISKQVLSLISVLAIGSSIPSASAETTVTSETVPNAPKVKPESPLFACVVKSRYCRQSNNYDDLVYDGNLQMFDCSDEMFALQIWRRITNHFFKNAFYMYCDKVSKTCKDYVSSNKLDKISDDMRNAVKSQSNCDVDFECYAMDAVNEKCYPK